MSRKRILTGDRPTGKLHLGHYVGSLANRVRLQDEYECFFIVADLHTLTTRPEKEHVEALRQNVHDVVLGLSGGGYRSGQERHLFAVGSAGGCTR